MIRLAVLDMAGTTVRDDGAVERAFTAALEAVGRAPALVDRDLEHVRAAMGRSKIEVFRTLLGDEARARTANQCFEAAYAASIGRGEVAPLPGAQEVICSLRDSEVRVCLTTGFSDSTREALVAALGWEAMVDLTLSPGPGRRGRPFPDLVLSALMALGIDAVQSVAVVGDTVNDLVAGHAAGAAVVAGVLTGAHGRDELAAAPHTHLLDSVAELPPLLVAR